MIKGLLLLSEQSAVSDVCVSVKADDDAEEVDSIAPCWLTQV